jgi:hypothetical protein
MFIELFKLCIDEHVSIDKNLTLELKNDLFEERKYFMPLADNSFPCFWLTIGIGNDTRVESMFKKIYPQCKIFGIDSNQEQFGDFDTYGTPLPFAVGKVL